MFLTICILFVGCIGSGTASAVQLETKDSWILGSGGLSHQLLHPLPSCAAHLKSTPIDCTRPRQCSRQEEHYLRVEARAQESLIRLISNWSVDFDCFHQLSVSYDKGNATQEINFVKPNDALHSDVAKVCWKPTPVLKSGHDRLPCWVHVQYLSLTYVLVDCKRPCRTWLSNLDLLRVAVLPIEKQLFTLICTLSNCYSASTVS